MSSWITPAEMVDKEIGDTFLSLVQDIATELDLGKLCHKILVNVGRLTGADRGSLFLVEQPDGYNSSASFLVPKLFDVTVDSGELCMLHVCIPFFQLI